ncbi:hypothetical protein BDV34DRAFT_204412 [Aspergillus parasiticus]|uniref:Uncharacterized protein n=1 Tax=Aspergillus parasiticus TaxID=5067 RepID=A0A5N6D6F1_ASPPA|nr:hypothetical protein BDV34DRAFT_204412 [Aspergillus parasiticus]
MTPHSIQICSVVCCSSSCCSLVRATGPNPRLSLDCIVSRKAGLSSTSFAKATERTLALAQSVACELTAFTKSSVRKCRKQLWETTTISSSGRWLSHCRAS